MTSLGWSYCLRGRDRKPGVCTPPLRAAIVGNQGYGLDKVIPLFLMCRGASDRACSTPEDKVAGADDRRTRERTVAGRPSV